MTLWDIVNALPEDTSLTFTAGKLRAMLAQERIPTSLAATRWVDSATASAITGIEPRKLRRRAEKWSREENPVIRVTKKGSAERSDWLFDEENCRRYAENHPAEGPTGSEPAASDPLERSLARATALL